MKLQPTSNVLFLLFIFIYQLKGDYTNEMWSVSFYFVLSFYLAITQFTFFDRETIPIYRWVFAVTGVFFILFFITEGLCFIYPHKYTELVTDINIGISGTVFCVLFLLLTIKSHTQ